MVSYLYYIFVHFISPLQLLHSGSFNGKQDACVETDDIFDGTNGVNASCICNVSVNIDFFSSMPSIYFLAKCMNGNWQDAESGKYVFCSWCITGW